MKPHPVVGARAPSPRRRTGTRASRRSAASIAIASSTAAPPPALERGPRLACAARARCGGDARRPRSCCSAGTISPPSAPPPARPTSPLRTLDRLEVVRDGDEIIEIDRARRAASCTTRCATSSARCSWSATGAGTRGDVGAALAARDRRAAGPTAPAVRPHAGRRALPERPVRTATPSRAGAAERAGAPPCRD